MGLFSKLEHQAIDPGILAEKSTHFSWLRTRMCIERTLLLGLLTGAVFIGLGFTVFQFFNGLSLIYENVESGYSETTHNFCLITIGIGTLLLFITIYQNIRLMKYLGRVEFREVSGIGKRLNWSPTILLAIMLSLFGVIAFSSIYSQPPLLESDLDESYPINDAIEIHSQRSPRTRLVEQINYNLNSLSYRPLTREGCNRFCHPQKRKPHSTRRTRNLRN